MAGFDLTVEYAPSITTADNGDVELVEITLH
jgi:hypothetical protein